MDKQMPSNETKDNFRRDFFQITEQDIALIRELSPFLAQNTDAFIEELYRHLQQYPEIQSFFQQEEVLQRAKAGQKRYFIELMEGDYGEEFIRKRLRMGKIHQELGVKVEWILVCYCIYMRLITTCTAQNFSASPHKTPLYLNALTKVLFLDLSTMAEAYLSTRYEVLEGLVATRTKELHEAAEKLQEVDRLKANFLSIISHELKTPLTAIKACGESLQELGEDKAAEKLEFLSIIKDESDRLEKQINDLIDFADLGIRQLKPRKTKVDVRKMLEELAAWFKPRASEKGITLEKHLATQLPTLFLDEEKVKRAFWNLLDNAIKYTPKGGRIFLETETKANQLEVRVMDTGVGISPDDLDHIFEPFSLESFQLARTRGGLSLGLAMVKAIVEAHGGTVTVSSQLSVGTTFTITIPLS